MAQIHNGIQYAVGLLRSVRNWWGERDTWGVERLSESIQAIWNPWQLPEHAFLRGERLCVGKDSEAALAANISIVGLRNPTGSRHIALITAIYTTAANYGAILRAQSALAQSTLGAPRDTRWAADPRPGSRTICRLISGTEATGFTSAWVFSVAARFPVAIVLSPGFEFIVSANALNTLTNFVTFEWEERPVRPGELVEAAS